MISIEQARQLIADHIRPLPAEEVSLLASFGRVTCREILADGCYPSADRSMMDGYVVSRDAVPGVFQVVGEIAAGTVCETALKSGEAMRIFTGAVLPEGGGRVVMQEECRRDGATVHIEELAQQLFVRKKGSEANAGHEVLPAGSRIGATEMAILAQVGGVTPGVHRQPVIRHLATGDELVPPDHLPAPGQIRDTNSSLIAGLLAPFSLRAESQRVADNPQLLKSLADADCDLLLISGGASVGEHDYGAATLTSLGFTIHFDKVNLRPGKPLTFATRGRQAAFVIPGNPVSHFVCFHVAIRLAIEIMTGLAARWDFLDLEMEGSEILRPNPRETFWPATVVAKNGSLITTPRRWSTSGDTFSLTGANALILVNETSPSNGRAKTLLLDLPHPSPQIRP